MLGSFKLREFADNKFWYDENGCEFSKRVKKKKKHCGKGEIAR